MKYVELIFIYFFTRPTNWKFEKDKWRSKWKKKDEKKDRRHSS